MHVRSLAATASFVLLASACGGSVGQAPLAADVPSAILATMADSHRLELSMDLAVDMKEINQLVRDFPELDGEEEPEDSDEVRKVLAVANAVSLAFIHGDDGSGGLAGLVNGDPAFEIRADFGALAELTDPTDLLEAEPFDVTLLARVGQAAISAFADLIEEDLPVDDIGTAIRLGLGQLPIELPEAIRAVVEAFADGQWAGFSGTIDVRGIAETLGFPLDEALAAGDDMMRMGWTGMANQPSTEEVLALFSEAMTFTRIDDLGGQAQYQGDLHTEAFLRAVGELFAEADTTGALAQDFEDELAGIDVVDVPGLVTVTLDGNNLTSARVNLLAAIAEAGATQLEGARADDFRAAVRGLEATRAFLVAKVTDHGAVASAVDGLDATTATWDDLVGTIPADMLSQGFYGGYDDMGSSAFGEDTGEHDAIAAILREAAVAQETYYVDFGTYASTLADLEVTGFAVFDDTIAFRVVFGDQSTYCVEAEHPEYGIWSFDSAFGEIMPFACN